MSVLQIKVQKLTPEAFAPYGQVLDLPATQEGAVTSDRFTFWPKLTEYVCDSGRFQIGVSTLYKRPFRMCDFERHYHTHEFMIPLNGDMIIVFTKNKGMDKNEEPDYTQAEAFLINKEQGVVINPWVWHWTPMPVEHDINQICSFAYDTEVNDVDIHPMPSGEVIEVLL